MIKSIKKKLKSSKGFSLSELLVAVALLSILGVAVTVMITAGINVYRDAAYVSESRTVQDTINMAVSDYLRYAKNFKDGDKSFAWADETGNTMQCQIYLKDGFLFVKSGQKERRLLNEGAYAGMTVSDFNIEYSDSNKVFSVSYKLSEGSRHSTEIVDYTVRTIADRS